MATDGLNHEVTLGPLREDRRRCHREPWADVQILCVVVGVCTAIPGFPSERGCWRPGYNAQKRSVVLASGGGALAMLRKMQALQHQYVSGLNATQLW